MRFLADKPEHEVVLQVFVFHSLCSISEAGV
jgi:hypothetical protein